MVRSALSQYEAAANVPQGSAVPRNAVAALALPPPLEPVWANFEAFFLALCQRLGVLDQDQEILVRSVAATLAIGGNLAHLDDTWQAFLHYLKEVTDIVPLLNNDQYLVALDIAARLTNASVGGGLSSLMAWDVGVGPIDSTGWPNVQVALQALYTLIHDLDVEAFPEAPADGLVYFRNGATESWESEIDCGVIT